MTPLRHNFAYGRSRSGKTTLAAKCAKEGMSVFAVTAEPGVTRVAFAAEGADVTLFTPTSSEELFVFLDYPKEYLGKHFPGVEPQLVLLDGLPGLQGILIGRPMEPAQEVGGIKIPLRPASGIIGKIPKSAKGGESNPEALSQAQYGVLGRYTRRLLTATDNLPFHTLITSTEQLDYDEKFKKDSQGLPANQAAGRPRVVKGWPRTEGMMIKLDLPALVSGAFLHLVTKGDRHLIHTRPHQDSQGVEWFADPRGIQGATNPIDWTNKSLQSVLFA